MERDDRFAARFRRVAPRLLAVLFALLVAGTALARAGGGHGYSGSDDGGAAERYTSGGGHGPQSGAGDAAGLVMLFIGALVFHPILTLAVIAGVIVAGIVVARRPRDDGGGGDDDGALWRPSSASGRRRRSARDASGRRRSGLAALLDDDPDFSEPLFLDFVAALATRGVAAAGAGQLDPVSRYLAEPSALAPFARGGWKNVVVGATRLRSIRLDPDGARVSVALAVGATGDAGGRWWSTVWTLARRAGVRSKGPGEITRLACPACGAGAERDDAGRCKYCCQQPAPGETAWALRQVEVLAAEDRPPIALGGYAEERGTALQTVRSPTLEAERRAVQERLPDLDWAQVKARFGEIFLALQKAWSERDLAALRPLTTDAMFAGWRYWIEAYRAAGLRNALEQVELTRIVIVRASLDRYHAAATARVFATMVDRTLDEVGRVVGGEATPRAFTEYWTFVRTLRAAASAGVTCAGCGASLPAGQSGQCPYCGGLVAAPAFDWILSRIDQDEDYTGQREE